MRVTIDRDECTGCGACWDNYPKVFEENTDDETAQIVEAYRVKEDPSVGEIPEDLEELVEFAAEECPAEVIRVEQ